MNIEYRLTNAESRREKRFFDLMVSASFWPLVLLKGDQRWWNHFLEPDLSGDKTTFRSRVAFVGLFYDKNEYRLTNAESRREKRFFDLMASASLFNQTAW